MSVLKIQEDDFLWKYYKKSYELEGSEVEKPTSLCDYFWGGVFGFFVSFFTESSLLLIWCVSILSFAVMAASRYFLGESWLVLLIGLITTIFILWPAIITSCFKSLIFRIIVVGFCIVGGGWLGYEGYMQLSNSTWLELYIWLLICVKTITFSVVGLVLVLSIVFLLTTLLALLFKPLSSVRFLKIFGAYLVSLKRRVCPLVECPDNAKQ